MTPTNRELFYRDPVLTEIPNGGTAKVTRPKTDAEWETLRWELSSFVCDGQYEQGLDRVLTNFLTHLSQPTQPAVWISGFYGSGKSHLVRVLEYLWRNVELPDGTRARDIVTLPDEIDAQLRELTTAGKRAGGLWSAAGTLGAGRSEAVRIAFLSVLFESAGLPAGYPQAAFTIWARESGYMGAIETALADVGRTYEKEVHDLYVSPVIARALLDADPTLAESVEAVRDRLQAQFPPALTDVSDEEMFRAVENVLRLQADESDELPLTLIVLDEMQQYIGEDADKALAVQNIVEGCSARFQSRILFVATGQSALAMGGTLQRLIDRFTVPVLLSDNDVETVVRKVVLQKLPEHGRELQEKLDSVVGEIDRQLGGTRYAPQAEEKSDLAPDYPVLPNRWRLWSEMLRAIDKGGKSGLVRSQLALIHGGVRAVAELPLGHVIGADHLFFDDQVRIDMVTNGLLLREVDNGIQALVAEGGDGKTKGRICALIFLLSQMSDAALGGDSGLRPTPAHLADLLVENLAADGARLRRQVPELLAQLADEGRVVEVDDEYRLLTQEDAEWERDFRVNLASIRDDAPRILRLRGEHLAAVVENALSAMQLRQGRSKAARKYLISWDQEHPGETDGPVLVWVRDEWSVSATAVQRQAREAGDEDPTVFVLLPKYEPDRVKELLASQAAAEETLRRPTPQTPEGRAAQAAMRARLESFERQLSALFGELVARAKVFQGGGVEMTGIGFSETVQTAAERSLVRLFPKFDVADDPRWDKVIDLARKGAPDALVEVGHEAAVTSNAVCREVLGAVTTGGIRGNELHRRFGEPPFGWGKDAVNGALLVLLNAHNLRAAADGSPLGTSDLTPTRIGKATFYKEDEPPSVGERLAVRSLFSAAGIPYIENEENLAVPGLLQKLKDLADRAGGSPPLPERPETDHLDELLRLGGNRQIKAVAEIHERLAAEQNGWSAAAARRERREAAFGRLERLVRHAHELPEHARFEAALAGIVEGRQLLQVDPDPLDPIRAQVEAGLRARLIALAQDLEEAKRAEVAKLEAMDDWSRLEPAERNEILTDFDLVPEAESDATTDLVALLDAESMAMRADRIMLVSVGAEKARLTAAKKSAPASVNVAALRGVVRSEAELDALLAEFREKVTPHLREGKTVII